MTYPTLADVECADRLELCRWSRFLPSPGTAAIGTPAFGDALDREGAIMNRISDRLHALGGFTPEISKALGWDR